MSPQNIFYIFLGRIPIQASICRISVNQAKFNMFCINFCFKFVHTETLYQTSFDYLNYIVWLFMHLSFLCLLLNVIRYSFLSIY